jgi:hypothetical protein
MSEKIFSKKRINEIIDLALKDGGSSAKALFVIFSALLNFEWVAGSSRLCLGMRIDG